MTDSPLALNALITWHHERADAAARLAHELEQQAAQQRGMVDAHRAAIQELIARSQQAAATTTEED